MITLRRAQIRRGVSGVDVTVKSSQGWAREFAPTWDMVMGHKRGEISTSEYVRRYMQILERVSADAWRQLRASADSEQTVTLLCYCREGRFCHTHLIIIWATERWPDVFQR